MFRNRARGRARASSIFSDAAISINFVPISGASTSLDSRITFSRTSNATLIGSDGTLQYAPHNLLTYSEQFDNAAWTKAQSTITSNSVVAPDGTTTADKLVEDATNSQHVLFRSTSIVANTPFAASGYFKAGERTRINFRLLNGTFNSGANVTFDLSAGTTPFSSLVGTATNLLFSITPVGNGWYRCAVSCVVDTTSTTGVWAAYLVNTGNNDTYLGDGTSGIYTWGAQLNVGALQPYYSTTVKNLLGYSQEFDNAAWTKSNSTITADVTAAPDGSVTADKLVEDTVNAAHFVQSANLTAQSGTAYTFSCYAKAAGRSKFELLAFALTLTGRGFDLSNGTTFTNTAGLSEPTASSITPVGNGWYRCSVTANGNGLLSSVRAYLNNGTTYAYTGDGTSGIFIWGAQFSDSASLDPYVYNPGAAPSNTAYYGPRLDYDPVTLAPEGLLIEEQRTNSIRNNTAQGAVSGTPGTAPTYWSVSFNTTTGIARSIVGTGTEDGIAYIDLRLVGTASGAGSVDFAFEEANSIAAATGQVWGASLYWKIAAGSLTGLSTPIFYTYEYNSSVGFVNAPNAGSPALPTTAPLRTQRFRGAATLSGGATTAFVRPLVKINIADGAAIDITLRIGMPQLELGAFATSVIPTTTAAATRAADVAGVTGANFSNWFNAVEGTTLVEAATLPNVTAAVVSHAISDGTFNQSIYGNFSGGNAYRGANVLDGGVGQTLSIATFTGITATNNTKDAFAYKLNDFAESCNGVATRTDSVGTVPVVNRLYIGTNWNASGNFLNGYIRSFTYYPNRLSNEKLQALTS